jgi:hypothetical protein
VSENSTLKWFTALPSDASRMELQRLNPKIAITWRLTLSMLYCRLWCTSTPGVACSARDAAITNNKKKVNKIIGFIYHISPTFYILIGPLSKNTPTTKHYSIFQNDEHLLMAYSRSSLKGIVSRDFWRHFLFSVD